MKIVSTLLFLSFFACCNSNNSRHISQKAKDFFSEGEQILKDRIKAQYTDSIKAAYLNGKAIEKFAAAYEADTLFAQAVLYASECTMYARDYQACIYWTSRLVRLDTSRRNINFCRQRIKYCDEQYRSSQVK